MPTRGLNSPPAFFFPPRQSLGERGKKICLVIRGVMCESLTDVRNHSPPGAETGAGFLAKKTPSLRLVCFSTRTTLLSPQSCPASDTQPYTLTGRHKSQSLIKLIQGPPSNFDHAIVQGLGFFSKQIWEQTYQLPRAAPHSPAHVADRWPLYQHSLKVIKHWSSGLLMQ